MFTRVPLAASTLLSILALGCSESGQAEPTSSAGSESAEMPESAGPAPRSIAEAVAEAHVGDEFWTVRGGLDEAIDETTGDPGYLVTRFCGDAAKQTAESLGSDWSCSSETYCERPEMCGNHCESLSGAVDPSTGEVRLIAHFDGMEGGGGVPIEASQLEGWATTTPCGSTTRLASDALE